MDSDINALILESLNQFKAGMGARMDKLEQISVQNATILATHDANIINLTKTQEENKKQLSEQHDVDVKNLSDKVLELSEAKNWVIKVVLGAVITGLIGMLGYYKFHP